MKVALINPPVEDNANWVREGRCQQLDIWGAPFPPLSLALVSRQLVNDGHETILIDAGPEGKDSEAVINQCLEFSVDFIIMTASTPTIDSDLEWFLTKLKSRVSEVPVAVIGIHVSTLPQETFKKYSNLEIIIMNEPELTALDLVNNYKKNNLENILGIAYKNSEDEIKITASRGYVENIDTLGLPDWEKINFENYKLPIFNKPFSLVHFARGCPFKCNYCTAHVYNGRVFRKRSIGELIKEIEFNISLGVTDFLFWTEMFTYDHKYLNQFLDTLFEKGLEKKIRWVCNSRVDTVTQEILYKMKKAGCWQIAFGFEFGTDKMLKQTKKGGSASTLMARKAAMMAHKAGILVDGHFMLGFPGESEEDVNKTIKLSLEMPLTFSHFYSVVPYPGAEIYQSWSTTNNKDQSWEKFDQKTPVMETEILSVKKIADLQKAAYRKFYFRAQTFFRILTVPNSLKDFINLIKISRSMFVELIIK